MMFAVLVVILAGVALVWAPLALIWSINVLFGLGIAYTFKTWAAALLLVAIFGSSKGGSK